MTSKFLRKVWDRLWNGSFCFQIAFWRVLLRLALNICSSLLVEATIGYLMALIFAKIADRRVKHVEKWV